MWDGSPCWPNTKDVEASLSVSGAKILVAPLLFLCFEENNVEYFSSFFSRCERSRLSNGKSHLTFPWSLMAICVGSFRDDLLRMTSGVSVILITPSADSLTTHAPLSPLVVLAVLLICVKKEELSNGITAMFVFLEEVSSLSIPMSLIGSLQKSARLTFILNIREPDDNGISIMGSSLTIFDNSPSVEGIAVCFSDSSLAIWKLNFNTDYHVQ